MIQRMCVFKNRWLLAGFSLLLPILLVALIFASVQGVSARPLQPNGTLSGYVTTPADQLIGSAAAVHLFVPRDQGECCQWETWVLTSGSGYFSIDLNQIPAQWFGHDFIIQGEPQSNPYFRSVRLSIQITDAASNISLPQHLRLTYPSYEGEVRNPDDFPASKGRIEVRDNNTPPVLWTHGDINISGTYSIGGAPSGNQWIVAIPPEDSLLWASLPMPVNVVSGTQYAPGNTQTLSPLYFRYSNVTGTVYTPEWITATWQMSNLIRTAWTSVKADDHLGHSVQRITAANGQFGLLVDPSGLYTFQARPEGTLAYSYTESIPITYFISVTPQQIPPLRLTYPTFQGAILDSGSGPVNECVTLVLMRRPTMEVVKQQYFCSTPSSTYRMGGVPDGDYYLQAIPEGASTYAPSDLVELSVYSGSQYTPAGLQWVDLYLREAQISQVNVFAYDPFGNPIAAQVQVWNEEQLFFGMAMPSTPAQFSDLMAGGLYQVQAWPVDSYIPLWANSPAQTILVGPNPITLTLSLRWPNLSGWVKTPEEAPLPPVYDQGQRVRPVEMRLRATDWSNALSFTSNISGQFSLATGAGDYFLAAYPLAPLVQTYTHSVPFSVTLDLQPPASEYPHMRLTYPRIRGTVHDPWGNPVPAIINLWRADGNYREIDAVGSAPGKPNFAFGGMPAGQYYVQAEADGFNFGPSPVYSFTMTDPYLPSNEFITLTLQAVNFEGYVIPFNPSESPTNVGIAGVNLRVQQILGGSNVQWDTTDDEGHFSFSGLSAGEYRVDVSLPPDMLLDWLTPAPYTFTLLYANDYHAHDFALVPAPQTKLVVGDVHYTDGAPVIDQNGDGLGDAHIVAVRAHNGQERDTITSATGDYNLILGPGRWWLYVEPNSPTVDWLPGEGQWVEFGPNIALPESRTVPFTVTRTAFYPLSGMVLGPDSAIPPTQTVEVQACSDEGECFGAWVEGGSFAFQAPAGVYRIWVSVDPSTGWLPPFNNGFIQVVRGPTSLGTLYLSSQAERNVRIMGRAVNAANGNGAADIGVGAWNDRGDWNFTTTNAAGNYQLSLMPGYLHTRAYIPPLYQDEYVVLPPQEYEGYALPGEIITGVNYLIRGLDATIQGTLVDQDLNPVQNTEAIVYAALCNLNGECWIVDEEATHDGFYELHVIGGYSYRVGVWLPEEGYFPAPELPLYVPVGVGQTIPDLSLRLIAANTRIHGIVVDQNHTPVPLEAQVYGEGGGYWAEDTLWPAKDPYEFNLYAPTPVSTTVTWTLNLWVDPASGYIPDPAYSSYEVVLTPGMTDTGEVFLHVRALDAVITGTVMQEKRSLSPAAYTSVFARGLAATPSAGLYFETMADANGVFTLPVLAGEYEVNAYLPPELADTHFRPQPVTWTSPAANPVSLTFQRRGILTISGALDVFPATALPADTVIQVFGASPLGYVAVTGTLAGGYSLPVISGTQWTVWAVYENPVANVVYRSPARTVPMGASSQDGVDLLLALRPGGLPDARCWTFDASQFKRLELPAPAGKPAPIVEIPAGTFPVNGQVEVCARPLLAIPGGNNLVGFAYELEARDSQGNLITQDFNKKVRLSFSVDPADLPAGTALADLQVMFYSPTRGEWTPLEDLYVNPQTGFISGTTRHFSRMGVHPSSVTPAPGYQLYLPLLNRQGGQLP